MADWNGLQGIIPARLISGYLDINANPSTPPGQDSIDWLDRPLPDARSVPSEKFSIDGRKPDSPGYALQ